MDSGHYVSVMRAAVLRHSVGESFSERVSEAAGVTVSIKTRARHVQGDERLSKMRVCHKLVTTKRLRQRRKANKKKLELAERGEPEGYRKGMALDAPANGERGEEEEDEGGGVDGGGDDCNDSDDNEIEEEKVEEGEPLRFVICLGSHTEEEDGCCCAVTQVHPCGALKLLSSDTRRRENDGPRRQINCLPCASTKRRSSPSRRLGARSRWTRPTAYLWLDFQPSRRTAVTLCRGECPPVASPERRQRNQTALAVETVILGERNRRCDAFRPPSHPRADV